MGSPGTREQTSLGRSWRDRPDIALTLVAFVAVLYGLIHLAWVSDTPLGRVPLLDAKENIDLARSIAGGILPKEPFYRAMGYPLVLALPASWGLSDADLMLLAGVLGLLTHAASGIAVSMLGWLLSGRLTGLWISGLLFACYPVALYFAVEVLDTSLSTSLLLWGLVCLSHRSRRSALLAGFFLASAVLVRPHGLPLLLGAPLLTFVFLWRNEPFRLGALRLLCVYTGALPVLLAYGLWQFTVAGQFGILPSQGTYNLWKGNMPGASGKYLAQSILLDSPELFDERGYVLNPARVESQRLFALETGQEPSDISAINRYWRQRLISSLLEDPGAWISLMGRKALYLLNDYEQYNNKTYIFQKRLAPALSWNPLGFGIVFVLGTIGMVLLWQRTPYATLCLLGIGILYGVGVWLFFAGDRFRFPLAAFCIVGTSGLAFLPGILRTRKWRVLTVASVVGCIMAMLTFPPWANARDSRTFVQDRLLLATAAALDGRDVEAVQWATHALEATGPRADVARVILQSSYNAHLTGELLLERRADWEALGTLAKAITQRTQRDTFLLGIIAWKLGDQGQAKALWQQVSKQTPMTAAGADAGALLQIVDPGESAKTDTSHTTWLLESAQVLRSGAILSDEKMIMLRRLLEVPPD